MSPEADEPTSTRRDYSESQTIIDLQRGLHSLQTLFHLSALCGIILSATLFAILYKQVNMQRPQMNEAITFINDYNNHWVPQAENARTNLLVYAQSHPNVIPILQKFLGTNMPPVGGAPKAPAP